MDKEEKENMRRSHISNRCKRVAGIFLTGIFVLCLLLPVHGAEISGVAAEMATGTEERLIRRKEIFSAAGAESIIPTGETFLPDWTVNEKSGIILADVREGGVGTVSYDTVPKEDGSSEYPYGHPDGPIYNSVRIPCTGYDFADNRVSIKYEANFPVGGQNITVYASLSDDVGSDGSDLFAEDELIGWFENWNVTSDQTKDGYKYVTIDQANYTDFRTIEGIVLQFNYEGNVAEQKTMRILGIDFHSEGEKPVFATDPKPFSVSEPVAEDCTLSRTPEGWKAEISEKGTLVYELENWDSSLFDRLAVDLQAFDGAQVTPILDGERLGTTSLSSSRRRLEIPVSADTAEKLRLEFSGRGEVFVYSVTATTAPRVTNWSTSNGSYFDEMESISDSVYQMRYVRNSTAGYPKVIVSVENWQEDYDIICVDIHVLSGKVLTGILLSDQNYLMTHWNADNIIGEGKHEFTFYYPLEIDPEWDGSQLTLYINPNSVSAEGYTYDAEFEIGISFMKSEALPEAEISVEREYYEYDYDGLPKSVSASVLPEGTLCRTTYIKDNHSSETPPSDAGEYVVRFEVDGTRELRRTVKEVKLVIRAVAQEAPSAGEWNFDFGAGVLLLNHGLEASYSSSFDALIFSGESVTPGATLYIRRAASGGNLASEAVKVPVPSKPVDKPEISLVKCTKTSIVVEAGEGVEYRLITGSSVGEWKDEGNFVGLKADTLYRVEARVKATASSFAGDTATLAVRTQLSNEPQSSVSESTSDSSASGCGCSIFSALAFLPLFFLASVIVVKKSL